MDGRLLEHPHAQFGGSLGGVVGFPYPLGHHHVYELAGHQLQSAAAASVPFSIDGLLSGSCAAAAASVVNPTPLLPAACGVGGDSQPFKLSGRLGGPGKGALGCRGRRSAWLAGWGTRRERARAPVSVRPGPARADGWTHGRMDGWTDGWVDGAGG
jgi:homeobox protein Unc-4